ncbi:MULTISPECIES: tripartite tricarboxylate transporter substrate-binding protein [unclassified Beijerinckia]|uniref:Bug family tripartite tricarboxylate transporter substrate binding protein n=1 Tax=unclassified Beijerinckia TaxID=2638183 RepID=UPI000899607C|nr:MULTISPECIES: tripartite tricarboxylate transporter substrate-binding protein [unclassified Beijerinckia]MDH7799728.1 tripartite-type tricarboxylate transporter receptor subunit TctC [Beijerinckia sp. GAS462]SED35112.1 Tripartite-type tricarboxylate transporter, receptor component TctC [Beijerinckia sp. 28-YEA-48]
MGLSRRALIAGGMAVSASGLAKPALAQSNVIKVVYPYAAGGGADTIARFLAEQLRVAFNEPVIVENRVGADGRIGVRSVVDARPDGRTFLFTPFAAIALHPTVYDNLPYNPLVDLAPIAQACVFDFALSTGPMTKARNLEELVMWLRQNPDKAAFGSPASGSIPHFSAILFAQAAKVELRHVPFRGPAPALADLVAGQIALASTSASDVMELHKSGSLRVLATTGSKRTTGMPDVPTYKEQGYDIVAEGWYGMYAPAKTPQAIVDQVAAVVADTVRKPEGRDLMLRLGLTPSGRPGAELAAIQQRDFEFWRGPIKASGFKPSD